MSPSLLFLGRRVSAAPSALSAHELTTGIVIWRRHLPLAITSGMSWPDGTLLRLKWPAESVTTGEIGVARQVLAAAIAACAVGKRMNRRGRDVHVDARQRQASRWARRPCPRSTSPACPSCRSRRRCRRCRYTRWDRGTGRPGCTSWVPRTGSSSGCSRRRSGRCRRSNSRPGRSRGPMGCRPAGRPPSVPCGPGTPSVNGCCTTKIGRLRHTSRSTA